MAGKVILAIDTALQAASACVYKEGAEAPLAAESLLMDRGHAEALLPLLERVMAGLDGGFASLSRVAVTVGPGSFTGLRVGIAAARAIGLACQIPVVGVSTLAALAAPAILKESHGLVVAAIDARHGSLYFAAFDGDGRAVVPPQHAVLRDVMRELGAGPLRLVGPGAAILAAQARAVGLSAEVASNRPAPDIAFVAKLGLLADPHNSPARPLYLKAPDAKPQGAKHVPLAPV